MRKILLFTDVVKGIFAFGNSLGFNSQVDDSGKGNEFVLVRFIRIRGNVFGAYGPVIEVFSRISATLSKPIPDAYEFSRFPAE